MSPANPVTPPKKGLSPVAIILIVVGAIMLIGVGLIVAGGLFVVYKAKQAGVDPGLLQTNPALAAAKLIAAMNPDVEVVRVDDNTGKIELRDKNTGETVLVDLEDIKEGRISFSSGEGKVTLGAGAGKAPSWAPVYPGAEQAHLAESQSPEGRGYTQHLTTSDSVVQVVKFYKEKLGAAGFEVKTVEHAVGAVLSGQTEGGRRNASLMIGQVDGKTTIGATFNEK